MKSLGIILARGGSKGIKNKNLINFCGKPLLEWTIIHCRNCKYIEEIFVSSDSEEILEFSVSKGVRTILRPDNISEDRSTSESGWYHALDYVYQKYGYSPKLVIAPQVTSPIRSFFDFDKAIEKFERQKLDSLLSVNIIKDFFIWKEKDSKFMSENYDFNNRARRQLLETKYHENGSFYIFKPKILQKYKNRLGGKIGYYIMEDYKSSQIDNVEDIKFCEIIMRGYGLDADK